MPLTEILLPEKKFRLTEVFIEQYKTKKPPFGFNGLGEVVYLRTYSRIKDNGKNEKWFETVRRVVEGTYNMQKKWIENHQLGWNSHKAQLSAQEMYERIFNMKFLPPGRGLWAMGSSITEERGIYAALNNCAFVSTEDLKTDFIKPFLFLMDMSMLGVGVGFDTKGANTVLIKGQNKEKPLTTFVIEDTRESWVESLGLLLNTFINQFPNINFDYSKIRSEGELIKGFGGRSSGPKPLIELHNNIRKVLEKNAGKLITITTIVDIMNYIGICVVAGNVRRTAEIAFGNYNSEEYLDLKNYKKNPYRAAYGWTSNNTIFADLGMDYTNAAERTAINGEPGYAWLENMKNFSRMNNGPDFKDHRVAGGNPCLEQSLESFELCCLVETFPFKHDSLEDYIKTLKYAYLYAKTVTLGKTHWAETNRVLLRNRRIGCSMSGIIQFLENRDIDTFKQWCEKGYSAIESYDKLYSDWFAIPKSIKTTSTKPSGSVSLLAGATPGCHWPKSKYYIRRIILSKTSDLVKQLKDAGFNVEDSITDKSSVIVEFPICSGENIRTEEEVSIWEKVSLAAFLQKYWADNQISCTVTFNPNTEGKDIKNILNYFQYQLKGISFLPILEQGAYAQMPYETITKEKYESLMKNIKKVHFNNISGEEANVEKFCDGESCII